MAFGDFTVTRASTKLRIGSNGLYGSVANNVPAFEFNTDGSYRGLLVEPGATNQIRNNSMTGAVAGTPGTLPTNWERANNAGLSTQIVGVGTEDGVQYIDIRYFGTTTGTAITLYLETDASIVASLGQTWTHSAFVKRQIFTAFPAGNLRLGFEERTSGGVYLSEQSGIISTSTTVFNRRIFTGTTADATVGRLRPYFRIDTMSNATAYDFTVRIGWPQMELGSVATSPIVTAGSTVARTADEITLSSASSLIGQAVSGGTIYAEVEWKTVAGTAQNILALSDGTGTNRVLFYGNGAVSELQMLITANGVNQTSQGQSYAGYSGIQKIALEYNTNDAKLYRNGASISTDTVIDLSALASLTRVNIGSRPGDNDLQANMWIRSVALFQTPLTAPQLAGLTAL
jgi:hypothetical protein